MGQTSEKYSNWLHFVVGYAYRFIIRAVIGGLVSWRRDEGALIPGCTVVIGMCSRLPDILPANLSCLRPASWPDLKEVIVAVDCERRKISPVFIERIAQEFKDLRVRFVFYSPFQSSVAELLKLPYVYSWLSWCLAIRDVRTQSIYIHDYDALLLGGVLRSRYTTFVQTGRIIQGVGWYCTNGIVPADRLVSTFEAFVDTRWIRKRKPLELFNKIGLLNGRRLDFDTLIDMQIRYSRPQERGILEMTSSELVHPAQMIHQYTVFRKFPGRPWNCAAQVMIPCFYFLGGRTDAFRRAAAQLRLAKGKAAELLSDGCVMNFEYLELRIFHKMCLLMVQAFMALGVEPFDDFRAYVESFYDLMDIAADQRWQLQASTDELAWIEKLLAQKN